LGGVGRQGQRSHHQSGRSQRDCKLTHGSPPLFAGAGTMQEKRDKTATIRLFSPLQCLGR
jgi:hypothetical protein